MEDHKTDNNQNVDEIGRAIGGIFNQDLIQCVMQQVVKPGIEMSSKVEHGKWSKTQYYDVVNVLSKLFNQSLVEKIVSNWSENYDYDEINNMENLPNDFIELSSQSLPAEIRPMINSLYTEYKSYMSCQKTRQSTSLDSIHDKFGSYTSNPDKCLSTLQIVLIILASAVLVLFLAAFICVKINEKYKVNVLSQFNS